MSTDVIYLSQEDVVEKVGLGMETVLSVVENVLALHTKKDVLLPSKVVLDFGEREVGRINAMLGYIGGEYKICGVKWIGGFPKNPVKYDIPRASALIIINSAETGFPLSIMDGTYISAMRTGASTGVGAKYLARKNSTQACIIGCGVQAITQLQALYHVLPNLKTIKLYDISQISAENLKKIIEQKFGSLEVFVADTAKEAVEGSDVVVTVTVADEPIVKDDWLKPGVFFSHVGSYQEEEEKVILNADKIVLDEWDQVLHRETPLVARMYLDGKISSEKIYADIGEIILGRKKGRESPEERIFYSPIGLGTEDVAVAYQVYKIAQEKQIGQKLTLWDNPIFHIGRK